MADVTIIPPSQVQGVTQSGTQQHGTPTPQPSAGTLVSGTIVGKDQNGNFLLKSPQGTFSISSKTPLTYNSDVTIRVGGNSAGGTSARIVSVNGEAFADFAAPEAETADSVSTALLSQVAKATTNATQTLLGAVRGVIVSAPPAPATEQTAAGNALTPGNPIILRVPQPLDAAGVEQTLSDVTDTSPTTTSIATAAQTATEPEQVAQNPQAAPALPQAAVTQGAVLPNAPSTATAGGTPFAQTAAAPVETELAPAQAVTQATQTPSSNPAQTNPQTAQAGGTPQPASTAANPLYSAYTKTPAGLPAAASAAPVTTPQTIPAQVVTADENGNIALSTPLGNVTVNAPGAAQALTQLSPGTALTLEVLASIAPALIQNTAPAGLHELASSWQSLKDIVNLEAAPAGTSSSSSTLLSRLPQLGATFVSESTAFITALIQGQTRKILGDDTVDNLKQNGREDLLEKFSSEASNVSAPFNQSTPKQSPGWQAMFLPFVFQEALQQARIYVKREPPKKEREGKQTPDTRFIVEVDLSETGPMQLDGLVRKQDKALAFDLIIRTTGGFSEEDRAEIYSIYNSAAELTGFKGTLNFQVTRDFPVKPLEEIGLAQAPDLTV